MLSPSVLSRLIAFLPFFLSLAAITRIIYIMSLHIGNSNPIQYSHIRSSFRRGEIISRHEVTYRPRFGGRPSSSWNRGRYSIKVVLYERNYLSSRMTRLHCANYSNRFDQCVLFLFFILLSASMWTQKLSRGQSTLRDAWVERVGIIRSMCNVPTHTNL